MDAADTGGSMKSEYKVEKDRFPVKVVFLDGTVREGHIFLALQAAHHEGQELVMDVLHEPEQFLPVQFLDGSTKLVNKTNVMMLVFPSNGRNAEDPDFEMVKAEVAVSLINQMRLDGYLVFVLPSHARRVKDFLNQLTSYLELRKNGDVYLINKEHILYVEEKR